MVHWRLRMIALWCCLAAVVVGAAAFVSSAFYHMVWVHPLNRASMDMVRGGVWVTGVRGPGGFIYPKEMLGWSVHSRAEDVPDTWLWRPGIANTPRAWQVRVPLWIPTTCAAVGAVVLRSVGKRRPRPWSCPSCG